MKKLIVLGLINLYFFQLFSMGTNNLGENLNNLVITLETLQLLLPGTQAKPSGAPLTIDPTIIATQLGTKPTLTGISTAKKEALSTTITQILNSVPQPTQQQVNSIINTVNDFAEGTIGQNDLNNTIRNIAPGVSQDLLNALAKESKGKEKVEEPEEPTSTKLIAWDQYIPMQESSFSNDRTPRYSITNVGQTITNIEATLDATRVSREQEYLIGSFDDALKSINALSNKLTPNDQVTDDQAKKLTLALYAFLEVTPLQNAWQTLQNIIEIFSLTNFDQSKSRAMQLEQKNFYSPGKILSLLSNGYLGNPVLLLRQEIDREIRNKNIQKLASTSPASLLGAIELKIDPSKRAAHIAFLARKLAQALNRVNLLTNLHLKFKQDTNSNLSLLDQDLFFFNIVCNWHAIETMFNELRQVLTPEEYNTFTKTEITGLDSIYQAPAQAPINDYFINTQNRINQLITNHQQQRPLISPFDILTHMNDAIKEGSKPDALKLARFIMQYIPTQELYKKLDRTTITDIVLLWLASSYQRFLACNYQQFKTQQQLDTMKDILTNLATKAPSLPKSLLDGLQGSLEEYKITQNTNEELNKILTEIDTNPELAANPQRITETLENIEKMDLTSQEKEQIKAVLEPRKNILETAQKIAQPLYDLCLSVGCQSGIHSQIENIIDTKLYNNPAYLNPKISGMQLSEEDTKDIKRILLESIIAYFTTEIYYGRVECPICSYYASYYLAQNAVNNFNSTNAYVRKIIDFGQEYRYSFYNDAFKEFFEKK